MAAKIEIRNFYNGHLNSVETLLYQCPAGRRAIIRTVYVTSASEDTRTVNIRVIKGSDYARIVPYDFQLQSYHTMIEDDAITLESGDRIMGESDVKNVISVKISGVEELA